MGVLWRDAGLLIWLAAVGGAAAGMLAGAFNGALITAGLSPLAATLATMAFFRGLAMAISHAQHIDGFPARFVEAAAPLGIAWGYWLLLASFFLLAAIVHGTPFGRWCYAIGDNSIAANCAAIPVDRCRFLLYLASGTVCGLAAVCRAMRLETVLPDSSQGLELTAIACVVLGGTLITGGRGGVGRTLLGLAVAATLDVALYFLGAAKLPWLTGESRLIVLGVLLVATAVLNERTARSLRSNSETKD